MPRIEPHAWTKKQPWVAIELILSSIFFAAFYITLLYWAGKFLLLGASIVVSLLTWIGFTL